MKAIRLSFYHMLRLIRQDRMLFLAGLAPLFAGMGIHFGVPFLEKLLIHFTGLPSVLFPYYGLFDIFLASISPVMYCFLASMVLLEERDDQIDRYLYVTGLGKNGYLISRMVIPAAVAYVITAVLLPLFRLTALSAGALLCLSLTGTLQGIVIALLIVTLSSNKLEGMAVTKLASLTIFGAVLPYFVSPPLCFCLSFLPSFWVGMAMRDNALIYMLPAALLSCIWIRILWMRYGRKRR